MMIYILMVKLVGINNPSVTLDIFQTGDAKIKLTGVNKHAWINRFSNRLHIASNDEIYFGAGGETDTDVKIKHNGNLELEHKLVSPATGSADLKPFAYGTIDYDGSILSGTGNFSIDTGAGTGIYKITFTGQSVNDQNTTTVVTVNVKYWPKYIFSYTSNGKLVVKIFATDGTTKENMPFSFVTYKN